MPTQQAVIDKLRYLYVGKATEENQSECAELLYELSKFYRHGTDKWSFVCQCALLNGSLLGSDSDSMKACITSDLEIMGKEFLEKRHAASDFNLVEFSNTMKEHIELKRDEMAVRLKDVKMVPVDEADNTEILTIERGIIETVRNVMEDTSKDYAEIMERISNKCVEVLGDLPCQFSHFAMGSLARQEITLYSDYENAMILGDGIKWSDADVRQEAIEYFRWYAILFDLILICFGETPISLIGIEGLNDHYSRDKSKNWFYDTFITCGIMFDSCLPYASKNPFGRKPTFDKPEGTDLILPSDEMLQYLTENSALKEGYHLSNMLLESKHVAGSQHLFDDFKNKCIDMANSLRISVPYIQQDLKYTRENLIKFNLTPTYNTTGWSQHAKKSFYRPMSVHIPFVSRLSGYVGFPSTSHIVEKLNREAGLSDEVCHNLLYAIAIANLVRTKVYSERTKQSDRMTGSVNMLHSTTHIMNIFDAAGDRSALDYYEISLGLRNAISEIVEILEKNVLHGDFLDLARNTVVSSFENHLHNRGNLKLHGDIYRQFQNFERACETYELALRSLNDNDGQPSRVAKKCDILLCLCSTNLDILKFYNSLNWCGKLIELEKKLDRGIASLTNIAKALTISGQCYTEELDIRDGFQGCVQEAEDIWKKLRSLEPNNKEHLKGLAELRDTEGFYFFRTRDFNRSIAKYHEAQTMFEEYFASGLANNDTIKVKNGIAMCLVNLERFEEASEMFDEIINFKRAMIGDEVADMTIAWYLRHKAICVSNLGKYEDAVTLFQEAINMRYRAPGSQFDIYVSVANTHRFLAESQFLFQRYEEAIKTSEEVLALVQKFSGTLTERNLTRIAKDIKSKSREKLSSSGNSNTERYHPPP